VMLLIVSVGFSVSP